MGMQPDLLPAGAQWGLAYFVAQREVEWQGASVVRRKPAVTEVPVVLSAAEGS